MGGGANRVGESSAGETRGGAVSQDNTPPQVGREDRSLSLGQADHLGVGTGSLPPTGEPWAKTGQGSKNGEVTASVLPGGQDLGVCEHPGCHLPVGVWGGHFLGSKNMELRMWPWALTGVELKRLNYQILKFGLILKERNSDLK